MKKLKVKEGGFWRDAYSDETYGDMLLPDIQDIKLVDDLKQQTPDEKVVDYLSRAEKIIVKWNLGDRIYLKYSDIVEIAKLLQREESK